MGIHINSNKVKKKIQICALGSFFPPLMSIFKHSRDAVNTHTVQKDNNLHH